MALLELANLTLRSPEGGGPVARILAQMPDPMRPDVPALLFVIVLLVGLYFYLRAVFFQPITKVMEDRERDLTAGGDAKAQAAAALDARQKDYQARLKDLRARAFERRKALADAAGQEKQRLLDEARTQALADRRAATESLAAQQAEAKRNLLAQVDALSESMAQTLLKQA
ncbi:ATP synthase F0 subunit B [Geothrix sp. 21YS21S-4]|uniref:ATP synthase F0 subunit B n=1 Tax=Geothrix sp. 21YS21S-4 TaxID=3068889 RepID=UPI0027B9DDC5|nr:ATP synthase F0 subunit B [Geothrix sp. 21YS21S-4]